MGNRGPVEKRLIDPTRVRRIREGFSWIDRRFVRDGWIERLERDEILLYFFLVAVADKDGLSYFSDARMSALLRIELESLRRARSRLVDLGLLAYQVPLTQVLSLDEAKPRDGGMSSLAELLAEARRRERRP